MAPEPVFKDGDDGPEEPEAIGIVITMEDGIISYVEVDGVQVRALVHDYSVTFPTLAGSIETDSAGDFYKVIIV